MLYYVRILKTCQQHDKPTRCGFLTLNIPSPEPNLAFKNILSKFLIFGYRKRTYCKAVQYNYTIS